MRLYYAIKFRLEDAKVKRDNYINRSDEKMASYWRGKVKAYKNCLDLLRYPSPSSGRKEGA